MIFNPALARKVMDGSKTVTRRLCNENPASPWFRGGCQYKPGSCLAVQMGRSKPSIGRIHVVSVKRQKLGVLNDTEARREGFESAEAFAAAWEKINGCYDAGQLVWRLEFELVAAAHG